MLTLEFGLTRWRPGMGRRQQDKLGASWMCREAMEDSRLEETFGRNG